MKRTVSLFVILTVIFVLLFTERAFTQEQTQIKVKGAAVVTGVVVVAIVRNGTPRELQCNQGAESCKILKNGDYLMVELPKNFGMYDCNNVEIYPPGKDDPEPAERIGAYCLMEK